MRRARDRGGGEEGDNDSEVELPLSAADEELMRTKSTALSKLSVSLAGVEVLFINDYEGLEQPLVEVGMEGAHFALEQCADAYQGDGGLRLRARFFNPTVLFWEPVVEPWEVRWDVSTEASGVVVAVATERVLYLDLTEAFLQTLSRTYSLFLSATDASASSTATGEANSGSLSAGGGGPSLRSLPSAGSAGSGAAPSGSGMTASPYVFTNRTGLELTVDGGGGPVLVAPHATVPLEVVREGRPVRGMSDATGAAATMRAGGGGGGGGSVTVAFTGAVGAQRQPLSKLRVDVPGTFVYALKPAQEAGGKVYPAPVVEETWENERSDRLTSHWRAPFLPTDRPRWSDEQGKRERKREDVALPGGGEWLWQDEWHVDMGYGKVGTEIDEDGWTYGVEFPGFSLNRIKRTYRDMDGVRRRRWIRTRIPVPPPMDDPTRPLAVAWRVALLPDGRTELGVEGTVRLVNETDVGLEVRAFVDPSAQGEAHPVDPVPPNGSACLPLLLAYASTVQVRPLAPAATNATTAPAVVTAYDWSPPFLISRGAGASEETVVAQAKPTATGHQQMPPVALVVDASVSGSGLAAVHLRPPFVVENFLPCHLLVSVAPHGPGTAHVKAIPPGATAGIVSRPPQVSQDVRVKLLDYGWSQDQEFGGAPSKFQNLKSFCLTHPLTGEELWLTGWVTRPKGLASRRLQMHVYTRNWVVDRTGLCLGFAEEPRPVARALRVRSRTVAPSTAATMGVRPLSLRGGHGTAAGVGGGGAVEILDVAVDGSASARPYRVAAVDNGSLIYTDRPCVFSGLPPRLRRKPALLCPNDDKGVVGEKLVSFRVSEGADVYLLYDVSGGTAQGPLPGWIAREGFVKAEDLPVVAVNTQRHEEGTIKFQCFHKHVPASSPWVTLGGNGSTRNNYVVVVGKEAAAAGAFLGAETASTVLVPGAAEWGHWEEEAAGMGLLLYDPRNHKQPRVCVCVGEEVAWSKPVRFVCFYFGGGEGWEVCGHAFRFVVHHHTYTHSQHTNQRTPIHSWTWSTWWTAACSR